MKAKTKLGLGVALAPGVAACAVAGAAGATGRPTIARGALCALTAALGWAAGAVAVGLALALKAAAAGIRPQSLEREVLAHVDCGWAATPGDPTSQVKQALAHWRSGECKVAARLKERVGS